MDTEEAFSSEYYQHLLSSLTINSRALITELTTIAERNIDHSKEICELVESRIKKSLPQHKLFAFYLLDSICKNIGNPYNLIFGANLHKIFTETYLVVTDTLTRQNLINLFKTWATAKTNSGIDLFPPQVIQKIEEFIIKATTISQTNVQSAINSRITPDMLLREGNYLLQYIIMLNNQVENLENEELSEKYRTTLKQNNLVRNNLISTINNISESIMMDPKSFEANVLNFHVELQASRRKLDEQSFQQQDILKHIKEGKIIQSKEEEPNNGFKIEINLKPNGEYFKNITSDIVENTDIFNFINSWGKPIVNIGDKEDSIIKPFDINDISNNQSETKEESLESEIPKKDSEDDNIQNTPKTEEPMVSSLGMSLGSFDFLNSFLGLPKNETTTTKVSGNDDEGDEDSYDPSNMFEESHVEPSPIKASSIKRPNNIDGEQRPPKRVRFAV